MLINKDGNNQFFSHVITPHTPWVVPNNLPDPVLMALNDLKKDWYKVFGFPPLIINKSCENHEGVLLIFDYFHDYTDQNKISLTTGMESYSVTFCPNGLVILNGADIRGFIYSIYSFSEKILGVDPLYYWTNNVPKRHEFIKIGSFDNIRSEGPKFKYRGWFINDEDILEGYFHDPLEENPISIEGFDKIIETLLRLKGNMLVPASFSYPDERCRDLVSRRGVIISDHHVNPLGLSMADWPDNVEFSYVNNRQAFIDYWTMCVNMQKNREMLWTVAFRGKNDHPFWEDDLSAPEDEQARADIISDAISKQVEIIRNSGSKDDIIFNMYHELADFYKRGMLRLPLGLIKVWPDNGAGLINDERKVQKNDGVYYHITGAARNRFTECVRPERIFSELGRFVSSGATTYCLVNVSSIRHIVLSINVIMDYIWDYEQYIIDRTSEAEKKYILGFCNRQYGEKAKSIIAELYTGIYNSINLRSPYQVKPLGDSYHMGFKKGGVFKSHFDPVLPDVKQHAMMQGLFKLIIDSKTDEQPLEKETLENIYTYDTLLSEQEADFSNLRELSSEAMKNISDDRKQFFKAHVLTQIDVLDFGNYALRATFKAVECCYYNNTETIKYINEVIHILLKIIDSLHVSEQDKWETWYMSEGFTCMWYTYDLARAAIACLKGEELPPVRHLGGYGRWKIFWDRIYRYHTESNYPMFYKQHSIRS